MSCSAGERPCACASLRAARLARAACAACALPSCACELVVDLADRRVDERARPVDDLHRLGARELPRTATVRAARAPAGPAGLLPDRQPSSPSSRPRFVGQHELRQRRRARARRSRGRRSSRGSARSPGTRPSRVPDERVGRRARLAAAAPAPRRATASTRDHREHAAAGRPAAGAHDPSSTIRRVTSARLARAGTASSRRRTLNLPCCGTAAPPPPALAVPVNGEAAGCVAEQRAVRRVGSAERRPAPAAAAAATSVGDRPWHGALPQWRVLVDRQALRELVEAARLGGTGSAGWCRGGADRRRGSPG